MRNKYDIYSFDPHQTKNSNNQKEKNIKTNIHSDKPTLNIYSILHHVVIWFFIFVLMFIIFFGIKIAIDKGFTAVEQKLNPYKEYSEFVKQGNRCFAVGDYDNAIKYFTEAITWARAKRRNSMAGVICFYRGNCYLAKNDLELALSDFELACKYEPELSTKMASNEVQDQRVKLCLYFAEKSFQENDMLNVVDYCQRALDFNERLLLNWKWKIHTQLRILIYESRISYLPKSSYEEIIKADTIWLEINKEYLLNDNAAHTRLTPSIYSISALDSNFDISTAEWHYDRGDYKSAELFLEKIIGKKEFKELDQTMQENFHTLIQLLRFLDSMSKPAVR
ncbi:MAG: tetratricopeptide repeat protein [Planctomycetaceae bacterium]|jgi:tetratricopeptide (TPR) repeat protein|nr:tetratricopeptide repeat protein [Planctomycetaceae bacterium]